MIIQEEDYLSHYGILRKSGRYPWGSGANPYQRSMTFFQMVADLREKGLSLVQIAKAFSSPDLEFTTTDLKATQAIARNAKKAADIATAERLKADGLSNNAIATKMGLAGESSVRALLDPSVRDRNDRLTNIANMLREEVDSKGVIDVGSGVHLYHAKLGMNDNNLKTALAMLKAEGYYVDKVQIPQVMGGPNKKTYTRVLAKPGTEYKDIVSDLGQIKTIAQYTENGGLSFSKIKTPIAVDPKRVDVRYKEDGGSDADGVIYVRPGVNDLSLGGAGYAQVRIQVGPNHYLKGMAMYKENLPDGVDLVFNTNKSKAEIGSDKLKTMKELKRNKQTGEIDEDLPFGSIVRQIGDRDAEGRIKKVTSAMNLVNEAGDWDKWSRNLSAQMLSKQKPSLIKERLDETFDKKRSDLDEILALTNPAVKKKLLESYAEDLDSAAVHLKAKGMPRQRTQVILPMNSLKETEVYAPNFDHGERVVLVRYPHGGKFEIPELTVNNNHRESRRLLGQAPDAIGINAKVAARLSGADFDGDTVVVIPNNNRKISHQSALKELEGFDPQSQYRAYPGMKVISPEYKQKLMGDVSNLITDMTIKGAPDHEIAQAVRHSMVVIDAEKHKLNYKQSALDNNIATLKKKYQSRIEDGKEKTGASTLISQKKSPIVIPERRLRKASEGGPFDPVTGKKVYVETGVTYPDKKTGKTVARTSKVKKLEYYDDANDPRINSGTVQERLYGDYSNRVKALANEARRESARTGTTTYSESAARVYSNEVAALKSKLKLAEMNAPLERQAQAVANSKIQARKKANPDLLNKDADTKAELKKLESLTLQEARGALGAKKPVIQFEDREWEAVQAGAIRPTILRKILNNADIEQVKTLATPKPQLLMTTSKKAQAQRLLASGNLTQAQVADMLGVSLTTLKTSLNG